jgi:ABC-2 type transport system ATP-binding protein
MIEINGITKNYSKLVALDDVSFKINDNECFALLGLNGAGKTTLINILSTQILPTLGTAVINGFDLINDRDEIRKIINISPQESAVAKNLTARENLELAASLYGVKDMKITSLKNSILKKKRIRRVKNSAEDRQEESA